MKCENVDNIFIMVAFLTVIIDSIGLFAELVDQRCEKKAEREQQEKENKVNEELENLRKRVGLLEKQVGSL